MDKANNLDQHIQYLNPSDFEPRHEVRDQAKLQSLVAAMSDDSYEGPAVLVAGDQALTGTHRLSAAVEAEVEINVIDLTDILDGDLIEYLFFEASDDDDVRAALSDYPALAALV